MAKILRVLLIGIAALLLLAAAGVLYLLVAFPKADPAPTLSVATTPDVVARGSYLFNHAAACVACHSHRDATLLNAPVEPGTEGMGGDAFGRGDGVPGIVYGRNLTPAALSGWSDGEIYRAIVAGVDKDGRALFPLMPYGHYRDLADGDVQALIAYLRALKPIAHEVPARSLAFPMNLIVRTIPRPAAPPAAMPAVGSPAYAAYVVNAAACLHCHSPSSHGAIAAGREFSGGVEFRIPGVGTVRSANLTPDQGTGLGSWTREMFIKRFTSSLEASKQPLAPGAFTSPMPWTEYAGMTEQDLGAIYDHLRTLPPVSNRIEKLTTP